MTGNGPAITFCRSSWESGVFAECRCASALPLSPTSGTGGAMMRPSLRTGILAPSCRSNSASSIMNQPSTIWPFTIRSSAIS